MRTRKPTMYGFIEMFAAMRSRKGDSLKINLDLLRKHHEIGIIVFDRVKIGEKGVNVAL